MPIDREVCPREIALDKSQLDDAGAHANPYANCSMRHDVSAFFVDGRNASWPYRLRCVVRRSGRRGPGILWKDLFPRFRREGTLRL